MEQSLLVCVLFNAPALVDGHPDAASESGVLESVATLGESLRAVGHQISELPTGESAAFLVRQLDDMRPDVVVNLCESFAGDSAREAHIAALLETLGLAYTGATPECLALTRNKAQTKRLWAGAGVTTAPFVEMLPQQALPESMVRDWLIQGPLIVKPACEDASLGIGQESVVCDWRAVLSQVASVQQRYGAVLVERYIAGREFNVGIIQLPEIHVLPLAEIEFRASPEMKWPILTYPGKWSAGSADDRATPVQCPATVEPTMARQILAAATEAYHLTGCRDYARVDLRVDKQGNVFVLEVNANPDVCPQAGLARMLAAEGISYSQFAQRLVQTAAARSQRRRQKAEGRRQKANLSIRELRNGDRALLLEMTRSCGLFRSDEIEVADELLQEAERHGAGGQYQALVAEHEDKTVGWACYGLAPMTDASFDLYWIVIAPAAQNRGIGRQLLDEVEQRIRAAGGRWLLADTSSTAAYEPTRAFYRRCGYRMQSEIGDFYRVGDGKMIFGKRLDRP